MHCGFGGTMQATQQAETVSLTLVSPSAPAAQVKGQLGKPARTDQQDLRVTECRVPGIVGQLFFAMSGAE